MGKPKAQAKPAGTADVVAAGKAALKQAATRKVAKPVAELSAADRENPAKLTGQALRDLAHRRGIARSEAEGMSDEKLRMQLRYITQRQYADAEEA